MKLKLTFYCNKCGRSTSTTNEIIMEKRICRECRRENFKPYEEETDIISDDNVQL